MTTNRRAFLHSSSLALVGAAFLPHWTAAASTPNAGSGLSGTLVGGDDEIVWNWIRSYSSRAIYVGGGVLARLRKGGVRIHILTEIASIDALQAALTGVLPFTNVRSKGNSFFFTAGRTTYLVENLLPEIFAKRLTGLSSAKGGAFAHDALSYNPDTQKLSDPFGAVRAANLKVVGKIGGAAIAFDVVLRGWIEAGQLGLTHGSGFGTLMQRVLGTPGGRAGLAKPIVATFVAQLPQLADVLTTSQIASLLRSRLVSGAVNKVLGVTPDQVISEFLKLRSASADADADIVAWLAGLLGPLLQQGVVPDWFNSSDAVQSSRIGVLLGKAASLVGAQTL